MTKQTASFLQPCATERVGSKTRRSSLTDKRSKQSKLQADHPVLAASCSHSANSHTGQNRLGCELIKSGRAETCWQMWNTVTLFMERNSWLESRFLVTSPIRAADCSARVDPDPSDGSRRCQSNHLVHMAVRSAHLAEHKRTNTQTQAVQDARAPSGLKPPYAQTQLSGAGTTAAPAAWLGNFNHMVLCQRLVFAPVS